MDARFLLALAVGPALALLWLFKKWDEKRPEPPGKVRNMVLWGVASCVPAFIVETVEASTLGPSVLQAMGGLPEAYLMAAVTEESLKLAVVLLYIWKSPTFDEVMDGILYTAAASLGFALLENVKYVFTTAAVAGAGSAIVVGLMRALTAVPLHATASGTMGYFVGRARFAKSGKALWILTGLAIAVFIHGTYDWLAMSNGGFGFMDPNPIIVLVGIVAIPLTVGVILRQLVKHALKLDDQALGPQPRPLPTTQPAMAPAPAYAPYPQPYGYPQPYPQPYAQQPPYGQPGYPPPAYPQPGYGNPQPAYGSPQPVYGQGPGYPPPGAPGGPPYGQGGQGGGFPPA